jgi:hypothetical protein
MSDHWLRDIPFFREQIAKAKKPTPYGDGLPAPWAFLDAMCDCAETMAIRVTALESELKALREQEPVAWLAENGLWSRKPPGGMESLVLSAMPVYAAPPAVKESLTTDATVPAKVPDGYVMVPRTPDVETLKQMHEAYWGSRTSNHWHENSEHLWRKTYWAMLAAAQEGK